MRHLVRQNQKCSDQELNYTSMTCLQFLKKIVELFKLYFKLMFILKTGYEYTFPFLSDSCGITIEDNQVKPLYNHVVNTAHPSMGLIGIPFQIVPFPVFDVQVCYLHFFFYM